VSTARFRAILTAELDLGAARALSRRDRSDPALPARCAPAGAAGPADPGQQAAAAAHRDHDDRGDPGRGGEPAAHPGARVRPVRADRVGAAAGDRLPGAHAGGPVRTVGGPPVRPDPRRHHGLRGVPAGRTAQRGLPAAG